MTWSIAAKRWGLPGPRSWILCQSHQVFHVRFPMPGGCSLSTQSHICRCLDRGLRKDLQSLDGVETLPSDLHLATRNEQKNIEIMYQIPTSYFCWWSQMGLLRSKSSSLFFISSVFGLATCSISGKQKLIGLLVYVIFQTSTGCISVDSNLVYSVDKKSRHVCPHQSEPLFFTLHHWGAPTLHIAQGPQSSWPYKITQRRIETYICNPPGLGWWNQLNHISTSNKSYKSPVSCCKSIQPPSLSPAPSGIPRRLHAFLVTPRSQLHVAAPVVIVAVVPPPL